MRLQKIVMSFIAVIATILFLFYGAVAVVGYMAVDAAVTADWSGGVRPVLERIWCGKPGCLKE